MVCIVSGPVVSISNDILPGAVIYVWRESVAGAGGAAVIPSRQAFTVGADGMLTMALFPGRYQAEARIAGVRAPLFFGLSAPDLQSAMLGDCLDQIPPITPDMVSTARQYRDETRQFRDEIFAAIGTSVEFGAGTITIITP